MGLYLGSTKIPTISFYKSGAIMPSGVFNIPSTSGAYDVTNYAFAQGDFGYGRLAERISGDISEYTNLSATRIASYAFVGMTLSSINTPNVTAIYDGAFYNCHYLKIAEFPSCISIYRSAFNFCIDLSSISAPLCSYIGGAAFGSCSKLTSVNFPSCKDAGNGVFSYCKSLSYANLPLVSSLGQYFFYGCYSLTTVNISSCTALSYSAFALCSLLSTLSVPLCKTISTGAFVGCFNLLSLYLMSTSMVSLTNTNAFASTPISNYTTSTGGVYGSIYVPSSLLASYKAATNWATYSDRIVGI